MVVARELEPTVDRLRAELGLAEPFHDPNVALFGLRNAVMALGDTFVEVVSPAQEGTAAGRHLDRYGGDAGYMVMVQTDDLAGARSRVASLGHRVAWEIDLPDIAGTHLHPSDVPGAIVSIDQSTPPQAWRWGGPDWTGDAPAAAAGDPRGVTAVVMRSPRPQQLAATWAAVLDRPVAQDDGGDARVTLDAGEVRFTAGEPVGIESFAVTVSPELARRGPVVIAGVRFERS